MSIDQAMARAWEQYRAGRLAEAEKIYIQVLGQAPAHGDALHMRGVIAGQLGQFDRAVELVWRAIGCEPGRAEFHNSVADLLHGAGRREEAIAAYREVIRLQPVHAQAYNNMGIALCGLRRFEPAIDLFMKAIELRPDYAEAYSNLGAAFGNLGKIDQALAVCFKGVELRPESAGAQYNLGNALRDASRTDEAIAAYKRAVQSRPDYVQAYGNMGTVLGQIGKSEEALAAFGKALAINPNEPQILSNMGNVLREVDRYEEAKAAHRRAIGHRPDYAEAYSNLGHCLYENCEPEEAVAACSKAIELKPNLAEAYGNLGGALYDLGRQKGAIAAFNKALQLKPSLASAHCTLGLARLVLGDFERGWGEYEWRWKIRPKLTYQRYDRPRWIGEDLRGKVLLLTAEQGLGDVIQFVRYAPMLAERGAMVDVHCQPALARLLARAAGVRKVYAYGETMGEYDLHCPVVSIPLWMGTRLETIPRNVPYLGMGIEPQTKPIRDIGLVWAGNPQHKNDRNRSMGLKVLAPLVEGPYRFHSLQLGAPGRQIGEVSGMKLIDHGGELKDFYDTAQVLAKLDLLITVDTSVAHLAGAMGKRVWVMLAAVPDWRWMLDREDTPWYPTMRLFRQCTKGDWGEVVERVGMALKELGR